MFETFDFEKFENENNKFRKDEYSDQYIFRDKGIVTIMKPEDISILPPNSFFTTYKEFYSNGNIKSKGKYFGDCKFYRFSNKIGNWYYFDEKGKLLQQVDEDKKFGKFSYNEVLKFLETQKYINLNTGEGRDKIEVKYYYSDKSTKKLWYIVISIGEAYQIPGEGYRVEQKGKWYALDGNTGETIKEKQLLNYREIIPDFEQQFPWLIESTAVYKTHEGKDYTQSEWQAYEEEEYEAYCKRTGRPYTPKSQEPTAENQGDKSPFLAEDWEKGDDKTPRKKGFWDNLFG
ncbi:hypothetical protein ACM39_17710 [Chryseobacterium sp. FH2]|nr:hypothetical protein ACM39_17710 [Chryseobacterium sp. FH2]